MRPLQLPVFRSALSAPDDPEGPVQWFIVRRRQVLVLRRGGLPAKEELDGHTFAPRATHYLGTLGELHCYAAEVHPETDPPSGMDFRDLMPVYAGLDPTLGAAAGRAVQIVEWDRTNQICGACGARTQLSDADRSRVCPKCGLVLYPRLAPAMIVAVERGDEILLARSPNFPAGIFSVLAGFVEPGESAEEAVYREVLEETGIEVDEVRYFGSQSWPFPNSLMLGFRARYAAGEIVLEDPEIEDAGWFRADDMPSVFPGNLSISQWLINDFLERQR